ncbi:MAG: hypothetical protein M1839_003180 [Geoglossum umbratile]|nr:MAG: hypothetical protein M1839_003180 [Geoglossum umbratile]
MSFQPPATGVLIIGGGIAGLALSLSLSRHGILSTIYEASPTPSTIGGAIHLPPSCLRALDHLGVLDRLQPRGAKIETMEIWSSPSRMRLGEFNFGKGTKTGGLRLRRRDVHQTLLEAVQEVGVQVQHGKKALEIAEAGEEVVVHFADGSEARGTLVVGADGIHSTVRKGWVDPELRAEYTGVVGAYGYARVEPSTLHFRREGGGAAMNISRSGSLLTSFCSGDDKDEIYVAAVMGFPDIEKVSKEVNGWRVRGEDEEAVKREVNRRFGESRIETVREVVGKVEEWFLFPVFALGMGGKWWRGRAILVGDAAHAMPPQGQSVGICLDDAILLSRLLAKHSSPSTSLPSDSPSWTSADLSAAFSRYDTLRRPVVDKAHKKALQQWENVKDISWFAFKFREWVVWLMLLVMGSMFDEGEGYDILKEEV